MPAKFGTTCQHSVRCNYSLAMARSLVDYFSFRGRCFVDLAQFSNKTQARWKLNVNMAGNSVATTKLERIPLAVLNEPWRSCKHQHYWCRREATRLMMRTEGWWQVDEWFPETNLKVIERFEYLEYNETCILWLYAIHEIHEFNTFSSKWILIFNWCRYLNNNKRNNHDKTDKSVHFYD